MVCDLLQVAGIPHLRLAVADVFLQGPVEDLLLRLRHLRAYEVLPELQDHPDVIISHLRVWLPWDP